MNIIILQGPNLNLLGLKSSPTGDRLTLDKLNKALRRHVRNMEITLKILQTHKQDKALNFLQRNRNWADGLLLIPTSWARYDWTIVETLKLISVSSAVVYFEEPYGYGTPISDSIISGKKIKSFSGSPVECCTEGINYLFSIR